MKILQINASYKPAFIYGGPTMSVSKLSEQMMKAGCSVEVYTTTANGAGELAVETNKKIIVDGLPVTYFKRLTRDHSHFSPALLTKVWEEAKEFDVIHIHAWWNLVSVFACWIAVIRQVPVIVSPRGTLSAYSFTNRNYLPKKIIHYLIGNRLLKKSNIHVTSQREMTGIKAIIQPKSITSIPNFIAFPDSEIMPAGQPGNQLKLLFLSRIEEKKGLDILLNALPLVTVPYHLTIAGDGEAAYIDKLNNIVVNNGVSKHVSWIGFQGSNKFEVLQQHDLMVLPSHDENFGNVIIESLSVGTAVLVSHNVGLSDYVSDNNLGWVCELSACSVASCINEIAQMADRLRSIRQQAPPTIRKDFDESSLTKKYVEMYNQIINNG